MAKGSTVHCGGRQSERSASSAILVKLKLSSARLQEILTKKEQRFAHSDHKLVATRSSVQVKRDGGGAFGPEGVAIWTVDNTYGRIWLAADDAIGGGYLKRLGSDNRWPSSGVAKSTG